MTDDDDFKPKLGRSRAGKGARERSYLHRVLQGIARAGGVRKARSRPFYGSVVGRGSGVARVLRSRDQFAAFRSRRVIAQARIVKLAGRGFRGARRHLRYIQRDGVTREGHAGTLYDKEHDKADGHAFLERAEDDRHQFRFIVSPEDGAEYEDLKSVTRRLMDRMEEDLRTKLEWVAADHYNTGHPHSHVIVRGKDDTGHDLIIAREYIAYGMRERAAEIVSLDLGPRSDFEVQGSLRNEMEQERFTSLDRDLLRGVDADGVVVATGSDAFRQSLRAGRLKKLERLGLAHEIEPGRWQLAATLRPTLQQMGERGDIVKTMHRELTRGNVERAAADYAIYDPTDRNTNRLLGRVMAQDLSDELHERRYLIVDGMDGRAHYVDVGLIDPVEIPPDGGIVAIMPARVSVKPSDRVITEIAAAHGGQYSAAIHVQHDPAASPEFVQSHIRRLEVLRRAGAGVKRQADGTWSIAPNHLDRVERYERAQSRVRPVHIEMLSPLPIEQQIAAMGATWLDRELTSTSPADLRDAGFGHEAREALDRRRQWLIAEGFARDDGGRTIYPTGMVSELQRRELVSVSAQLSSELGSPYTEAAKGGHVAGIYRHKIDLASGRFAVIENSREFTLVPWRPVLDQSIGKKVSGVVRGDMISWTFGRQRGGPAI
ncbi:MAG TPA: relaxase/mobilization nuclease RlxS [Rhizomicrobium sp.]